jgi:hypothetical protein
MSARSAKLSSPFTCRSATAVLVSALVLLQNGFVLAQEAGQGTAQSGTTEQAVTELMRTGLERYSKKDLEGARDAFQKAWKLRQHAAIAASLAEVELKLARYRDAAEHLSFYLANLPSGKESSRGDAEQQLAECKKHIGTLSVTVEPATATVLVDGVARGEGAIAELFLEPGEHALQAEKEGRSSTMLKPSIAEGEVLNVRLTVKPAPAEKASFPQPQPPAPARVAPAPRQAEANNDTEFWVVTAGGALSVAALTVGVMYTLQANSAESEGDDLLRQIQRDSDPQLVMQGAECAVTPLPAGCAELASARQDADSKRNLAIGSFVTGGVLAAATVGAIVFWPERKPAPNSAHWTLVPWGGWQAPGLLLNGTF